jgi:hypothetical protein
LSTPNSINNCNYNQAFDLLKHLYSLQTTEPDKTAFFKEKVKYYGFKLKKKELNFNFIKLIEFDQTEFFPSGTSGTISMDSIGFAYVPRACSEGRS